MAIPSIDGVTFIGEYHGIYLYEYAGSVWTAQGPATSLGDLSSFGYSVNIGTGNINLCNMYDETTGTQCSSDIPLSDINLTREGVEFYNTCVEEGSCIKVDNMTVSLNADGSTYVPTGSSSTYNKVNMREYGTYNGTKIYLGDNGYLYYIDENGDYQNVETHEFDHDENVMNARITDFNGISDGNLYLGDTVISNSSVTKTADFGNFDGLQYVDGIDTYTTDRGKKYFYAGTDKYGTNYYYTDGSNSLWRIDAGGTVMQECPSYTLDDIAQPPEETEETGDTVDYDILDDCDCDIAVDCNKLSTTATKIQTCATQIGLIIDDIYSLINGMPGDGAWDGEAYNSFKDNCERYKPALEELITILKAFKKLFSDAKQAGIDLGSEIDSNINNM